MRPAFGTILVAGLILAVLASAAYVGAMRLCARQINADDLSWLKREFHLSDSEMSRIRQLHEGYMPKCREMCARIAARQAEVASFLANGDSPEAKLVELGTLRAQCQAQMLRHFEEVSRAMPREQGKRYLSEMERLTLGFHADVERSMGEAAGSGHAHGER